MVQRGCFEEAGDAVALHRATGSETTRRRPGGGCGALPGGDHWRADRYEVAPRVGLHKDVGLA
eukprot:1986176-Alexandrium_andersonii.AAC.1